MFKSLVIAITLSLIFYSSAFASGFQLKSIGSLDVTGAVSSECWYTNANPSLIGITTVDSTVTVKIDDVDYEASVDGEGNWSFNPTTLLDGDHSVLLTSSAGSQSFTLHIGQNIPVEVTAPTPQDLPVAGSSDQTLWLILGAFLILGTGVVFIPTKK